MSKQNYKNFQSWRVRTKQRLVAAFGGACGLCGYNRCLRNLVFHHLDPSQKDFAMTGKRIPGWAALTEEAAKCIMLCANCHGEVHAGLINDVSNCPRLNLSLVQYEPRSNQKKVRGVCAHCSTPLPHRFNKKYCSRECFGLSRRGRRRRKIEISESLLRDTMRASGFVWTVAAHSLGVSDNGLRKIAAFYGLPTKRIPKNGTSAWY